MNRETWSKMPFEELLRRARAKEPGALDELVRRSEERLGKWARGQEWRSQEGDRPSDISQSILERVVKAFPSFQGNSEGEWFGFLKTTFDNHLYQAGRDAGRQKRAASGLLPLDGEEVAEKPSPDRSLSQTAARREEWHRLSVCIYELPSDQGEAVRLRHIEDLPFAEVARRMKRTRASVEGLVSRGWIQVEARMREAFAPEPGAVRGATGDAASAFMAYLRRCDAGEEVDRDAFIAEHPDCADTLRDMIHWIERLRILRPNSPPNK